MIKKTLLALTIIGAAMIASVQPMVIKKHLQIAAQTTAEAESGKIELDFNAANMANNMATALGGFSDIIKDR